MLECLRCLIPSPSCRLCLRELSMGFGAHGKKRQRLGDDGPSESKRAFSGQGSGDDARGSITSKEPATQFLDPHFPDELASLRDGSISRLTSDSSSISTIAEYHNADASSRCTSRDGDLSRIEWPDAWEQPSVGTKCITSEETGNWASSFSDLRSELTVSGHDAFDSSSDSHLICELNPSVGLAMSTVRSFKMRGNIPLDSRQVPTSCAIHSARSCGRGLTRHFKEGLFRRDRAVDTSSELQEFDEAAAEKQPHSSFSKIPLESIPQESSAGLCMDEQPRGSISVGEDRTVDIRVSPDSKGAYVEGRSGRTIESLADCPTIASIEEDALSGEFNGKAQTEYVHSSGRLSLEERARLGERSPTIDHDFEDYFSALLL